ncbi:MAG: outer membrane beta-barrel protein [Rhodomicrobium sp.]
MFRHFIFASASVIALTAGANAADIYRASEGGSYKDAPYVAANWSGWYVGVNGGYAWAGNTQFVNTDPISEPFSGLSPDGGFGGGQAGYNLQGYIHPNLVVGIEADIQGASIGAKGFSPSYDYKSNLDYFGTVRGRLGYANGPTLLYFTGGFAFGGVEKVTNAYGSFFHDAKLDTLATGYVLGGGIEYKLTPKWSLKGEYQYLNLGKNDVCASPAFQCFTLHNPSKDDDYHTVRAGLNYHITPVYEPLK